VAVPPNDTRAPHGLWERVAFLEQANRWYGFALEMLAECGDLYAGPSHARDPVSLLERTADHLQRVVDMESTAFLLVDEESADFEIVMCAPRADRERLQREVDDLIERGEFAWAINQNRALTVESRLDGRMLLLNVLATRNRVRGMFVAILQRPEAVTEAVRKLVSVIINSTAYALENAALYKLLSDHNRDLEAAVRRRTQELEYQYSHDRLTGFLNRLVFIARLEQAIASSGHTRARVAVLSLDLDVIKRMHDAFGHAFGDALLRQVADRLRETLYCDRTYNLLGLGEHEICVARLVGDEFSVLLPEVDDIDALVALTRWLIDALGMGFMVEGEEVFVTASAGISVFPEDGVSAEELLKHADVALSHAKVEGRGRFQFFDHDMNVRNARRLEIERQLRQALRDDGFIVHYQPKVDLRSGAIMGAEALLRLPEQTGGAFTPSEFIPVAESTGLIRPIGAWVMREVCRQIAAWRSRGLDSMKVSVNLSAEQLGQETLVESFLAIVDEEGVGSRSIELELTETAISRNPDRAATVLAELNRRGFAIAIDDFGTGYSTLLLLKRFPIDTLKIDRSFVMDVTRNSHDAAIVTAVVAMASSLGLKVVAEGVETETQLDMVKALGCDEVQGYYVGYPVAAGEFEALYRKG
jgi:diguanylate cyclase (GGDEF)-like protein